MSAGAGADPARWPGDESHDAAVLGDSRPSADDAQDPPSPADARPSEPSPPRDALPPGPQPGERGVPWYVEGVRFECTACGRCCTNHGDGFDHVFSTRDERRAIARHLGLSLAAFEVEYCHPVAGTLSFVGRGDACVFLDDRRRCSIYALRPKQCRTFPFWPEVMASERAWQRDVASFCPGVGQGPLHDVNEIRRRLAEWR